MLGNKAIIIITIIIVWTIICRPALTCQCCRIQQRISWRWQLVVLLYSGSSKRVRKRGYNFGRIQCRDFYNNSSWLIEQCNRGASGIIIGIKHAEASQINHLPTKSSHYTLAQLPLKHEQLPMQLVYVFELLLASAIPNNGTNNNWRCLPNAIKIDQAISEYSLCVYRKQSF